MSIVRYPSLELNWLPNSLLKQCPTPVIEYVDTREYGGSYTLDGNRIEISTAWPENMASTIAHEFRHCWQHHNWFPMGEPSGWHTEGGEAYRDAIVRYFITQPWEMDALLFERKNAQSDTSEEWWGWLMEQAA